MAEIKLDAESRNEFGKGAARRIRRAGRVPAVLYGHGTDPVHISLPGHETQLALRTANALLDIALPDQEEQLALPKQIQRDPIRGTIEHIDLVIVRRGEKVIVEVPLVAVGDHSSDVMVVMDQNTISLEVLATAIPAHIDIDVSNLQVGQTITAADLVLPDGAVFPGDPGDLMLSGHEVKSQAALDAELAAAVGEAGEEAEAPEPAAVDGDDDAAGEEAEE